MSSSSPFACPRCSHPAAPQRDVQVCSACRGSFTLHAGAAEDPSIRVPPADPASRSVKVKAVGLILIRQGVVSHEGISVGVLDPVTGLIPIDTHGVPFGEIRSIAVWRTVDVLRLATAFLIPFPLMVLIAWIAIPSHLPVLIFSVPPLIAFGFLLYLATVFKAHHVRVAGIHRVVELRFDRPFWRLTRFHTELLRRAGIPASPIP